MKISTPAQRKREPDHASSTAFVLVVAVLWISLSSFVSDPSSSSSSSLSGQTFFIYGFTVFPYKQRQRHDHHPYPRCRQQRPVSFLGLTTNQKQRYIVKTSDKREKNNSHSLVLSLSNNNNIINNNDDNYEESDGGSRDDGDATPLGSIASATTHGQLLVWKFGGSSVANAERIRHVCQVIKDGQDCASASTTDDDDDNNDDSSDEKGNLNDNANDIRQRPLAVICSAMGKTTNMLLDAGQTALHTTTTTDDDDDDAAIGTNSSTIGSIMDPIRRLHLTTMDELGFNVDCQARHDVNVLLDEMGRLLFGISYVQELSTKNRDRLVSYGERCSVRIIAEYLNSISCHAVAMDAWDAGVYTDSQFGDANLLPNYEQTIRQALGDTYGQHNTDSSSSTTRPPVAIITGFLGHDPNGYITTLGRGGSDLTATAIGAALQADEIWVWKDVDGILSADPRTVPNAVPLDHVTYEEASELAYFGAQVLHPIAMQPAYRAGIPVRVKNSYNPQAVGTLIGQKPHRPSSPPSSSDGTKRLVTALTSKDDVTVLDISSTQMLGAYGFLARVFRAFEEQKLSVDVLSSSEVSVSLTLDQKQDPADIKSLMESLGDVAGITRKDGMSILTLIADVDRSSEVLATVFTCFAKEGIHVEMMSQGASKVNISFVVCREDLQRAILKLHSCFF